jgi:Family of unknown function (DUF5683)
MNDKIKINAFCKSLMILTASCLALSLAAQKPVLQGVSLLQSVKIDTSKKAASLKSDFPSPKKALLWSIIPTGGQIYNQKYWYIKVPIALGGYGFAVERISTNGTQYRNAKNVYFDLVNSPNGTNANGVTFMKQQRDDAFKAYQQSWIFLTIWHLFCAAEAFTAAHLAHFDVSEDLSWQIRRGLELRPATTANGFGIQLKF